MFVASLMHRFVTAKGLFSLSAFNWQTLFLCSVYFCIKRSLFPSSVPGLTTTKGLAVAFQANDPHASAFTLAILRLHENDFLNSLQRKWWETNNECQQEQETSKDNKETSGNLRLKSAGLDALLSQTNQSCFLIDSSARCNRARGKNRDVIFFGR